MRHPILISKLSAISICRIPSGMFNLKKKKFLHEVRNFFINTNLIEIDLLHNCINNMNYSVGSRN